MYNQPNCYTTYKQAILPKKPAARLPAAGFLAMHFHSKIFDFCFNNLEPLIINKTPETSPVANTQIPRTRL